MAEICREIQERIEERVERPVEQWVEREERRCRRRSCNRWCLCCNKWFCWLVTIFVRVVVMTIITIVKWVTRVVCEVVSVILDAIAFIVGLIFAIPIIGRLIRQIWNFLVDLIWRVLSIPGLILDLFGIRLRKFYRICVLILDDGTGATATEASLAAAIAAAQTIYLDQANVDLVVDDIKTIQIADIALDVSCDVGAWWEDLWTRGTVFEFESNLNCFDGAGRRLIGYAAPVTVFVVRSVEGAAGCSLGQFSEYVTIEGPAGVCLAHELGHACGLWHHGPATNLMNGTCGGTQLEGWQIALIRSSRHVTYI